ncbi:PLAC8 family-domain-containing protein [Russula emetica]|nr:PLAC8 family-domain-containing protein [Russula emetica]
MTPKNTQNSGGGNRNALRIPVMEDGLRGWSYDIFDCFADPRTCMCALSSCCCCYAYSRNHRRFEHLERHGTPLREPVEACNRDCQWYCLFGQAALALQAISRYNVRRRYGIHGDAINDVLVSGCCHPCELVQEHREIQLEESSFDSD